MMCQYKVFRTLNNLIKCQLYWGKKVIATYRYHGCHGRLLKGKAKGSVRNGNGSSKRLH